ncbi:MAG: Txe/YoeB family addiction module toxin [Bacteroidaceae bacterium]|nr:Txe/YoeB family addiction module toxin [Bacteroidaceae bacterium]MBR1801341.1 Txe/YoeB family addiction module toxin [Bacteroidaceae bacterium]
MPYTVLLSEAARTELSMIKKSGDKATIKKVANLLLELQEHPRTGTGQVEHLKHFAFEETWSRRINKHYRMIYEIHDVEVIVTVVSLRSHYGDK